MNILLVGALVAGFAVAIGAFGAHALRARLGERIAVFQTGVHYQMLHGMALLALGVLTRNGSGHDPLWTLAAWLFVAGTILFSGSLYLLAQRPARWLGPVTPLGGLLLVAGWTVVVVAAARPG